MKKINLNLFAACFLFAISCQAQLPGIMPEGGAIHGGGIGGDGTYIQCGKTKHGFVIRATAAPSYIQGLYTFGSNATNFECTYVNKSKFPSAPSAGLILWNCDELRDPNTTTEGALSVTIETGGVTGLTEAKISAKQIFPLPEKPIETFQTCRVLGHP